MSGNGDDRRVLVIGGGAAGIAAALAARAAGAHVTLVRQALGATSLSSGALDLAASPYQLAADPWRERPTIREAYNEQRHLEKEHPLTLSGVSVTAAERALGSLCETLPLLEFHPLDRPPLVLPTDHGTFKSTTLCQAGAVAGDLLGLDGARIGVVGIKGYPSYAPDFLAAGYAHHAARGEIRLEVFPLSLDLLRRRGEELMHPHELARELERAPRRHQLADALRVEARRHRLDCLFLPPVMGMGDHRRLMRALNDLGTRAAEIMASPPSVPGLRLQQALDGALQRAGIPMVHDRAVGHRSRDGQITGIELRNGETLEAEAFVLASGKFIGRGLVHERRLREPLFDLPVWIDGEDPGPTYLGKQMSRAVAGPHPLMRAGLRVSPKLQPLGVDGQVAWANLYGAGSVLGGYDYITGRCGLGTALITGSWAGARASGIDPTMGGEP